MDDEVELRGACSGMNRTYGRLFGPVPSRRFGRSLGVDLVPYKTCTFDCIFCQLGRTTTKTVERREYVPVDDAIAELDDWLKTGDGADYIALSGSGEPTLNAGFGRVIEFVRRRTKIPVAVLTNGSLVSAEDVRDQAAEANVVKISLSAWDQASLNHVNRPHPDIRFEELIEGSRLMREQFAGQLWMEVFLVWGTNALSREVAKIASLAKTIRPDKIHLNTAARPPCEEYALAVPRERMVRLGQLFEPPAEIIAEFASRISPGVRKNESDILQMLRRRPCTLDQICGVFGLHRNEAAKYVGKLMRTGRAEPVRDNGRTYYTFAHGRNAEHADL